MNQARPAMLGGIGGAKSALPGGRVPRFGGNNWGAIGQGNVAGGALGAQQGTGGAGYQPRSGNTYAAPGNGYTPSMNAMNYGSYAGTGMAMGAPVQGIPIWGQNGQPMQQGGGSFMPMTYQQANSGGQQAPRPTQAQQFINDVQQQATNAKQANETRYDAILNGDQGGMMMAFANQLRAQYPGMSDANIQKMISDPRRMAQFQQANPQFGGYRDRFQRGMSYLDGAGAQALKDINTDYTNLNNRSQMDLMKRGLGSSTITANQSAATERRKQDAIGREKERLRGQYLDTDARLSGDTLSFMERRNDTYPDQMQIANLMMQFGNAGMLGYSGGGGGGMPVMTYGGQKTTSSYGVNNSRGFNQPSAYATTKWY